MEAADVAAVHQPRRPALGLQHAPADPAVTLEDDLHLLAGLRAEDLVVEQRLGEAPHVVCARDHAAHAAVARVVRGVGMLRRAAQGGVAVVATRLDSTRQLGVTREPAVLHARTSEHLRTQEVRVRRPAGGLDDGGEQRVPAVPVLRRAAGFPRERLAEEASNCGLRVRAPTGHHATHAGGVGQQVAHRDGVLVLGDIRKVLVDRIIQSQSLHLDQPHHATCRDHLGDGRDLEQGGAVIGPLRGPVSQTVALAQQHLALVRHDDRPRPTVGMARLEVPIEVARHVVAGLVLREAGADAESRPEQEGQQEQERARGAARLHGHLRRRTAHPVNYKCSSPPWARQGRRT